MILSLDAETVFDKIQHVIEPQFRHLFTMTFKKNSYQIRNPINFLNFIQVTSQESIATLYLMENFRRFPYKLGARKQSHR